VLLAASDLHCYDDGSRSLVRAFAGYVQEKKPGDLIFCGDIFDPWKAPWDVLLGLESTAIIQTLIRNRADAGLSTWYIRGNHDHTIRPEWIEGAEVVNKVILGNMEFRHGWERDAVWAVINRPAFWIADHLPSVALRIHKMLYGEMPLSQYTVAPDPLSALEMCERWNLHVGAIHTLWREYADRNKRRVVIGHTHCAWVDPLLCDCGSLAYGQWLEIGESVEVKTLKGGL